jgi:aromatic-L-amino-acid decarboxylase
MVAFMREHIRLAGLFADWIKIDNRFELAAPVVLPVVCFRFVGGDKGKIDISNSEIVGRINASGRAYLTQTKLRAQTVMRIGLGNVLTTEQHLRNLWELIQKTAEQL